MNPARTDNLGERFPDAEAEQLVRAWLAGDAEAERRVGSLVHHHAQVTAQAFLARNFPEAEDLVQDASASVMAYLRRRDGFAGSLVNFTISVTRNRCRNFLIWLRRHPETRLEPLTAYLAGDGPGPLDTLLESEVLDLLQRSLDALDPRCRALLRAFYLEDWSMEEIRRASGLKSVQSAYYRRARCLEKAGALLKSRLFGCSSAGPAGEKDSRDPPQGRSE